MPTVAGGGGKELPGRFRRTPPGQLAEGPGAFLNTPQHPLAPDGTLICLRLCFKYFPCCFKGNLSLLDVVFFLFHFFFRGDLSLWKWGNSHVPLWPRTRKCQAQPKGPGAIVPRLKAGKLHQTRYLLLKNLSNWENGLADFFS